MQHPKRYSRTLFHHETDADGVCHFSNYFRIAEETFFFIVEEMGRTCIFAIREATAQYLQPLRFGNQFEVTTELIELRRSNFTLSFSIQTAGQQIAHMQMRFVSIDPANWEPIPLSLELKERLKHYDASHAAALV